MCACNEGFVFQLFLFLHDGLRNWRGSWRRNLACRTALIAVAEGFTVRAEGRHAHDHLNVTSSKSVTPANTPRHSIKSPSLSIVA